MDYSCDPFEVGDGERMGYNKHIKHMYIVYSNLLDAINDCSRNPKCTMVHNNEGYDKDFRLCNGIPTKTEQPNTARRDILYTKSM